jgi:hypothetical protein
MDNVRITLENSCWYDSEREHWENIGYNNGYESAMEDKMSDVQDSVDDWMDKLKAFLNGNWINLNKEAKVELESWFQHYGLEI